MEQWYLSLVPLSLSRSRLPYQKNPRSRTNQIPWMISLGLWWNTTILPWNLTSHPIRRPSSYHHGRKGTHISVDNILLETTLENPDHRLVNLEVHHFPPASLEEVSLLRFSNKGATTQELPPSSPPSPSPSSADHWEEQPALTLPVVTHTECWCEKEDSGTCGYEYPNTPPTPPYIVLWEPGAFNLWCLCSYDHRFGTAVESVAALDKLYYIIE